MASKTYTNRIYFRENQSKNLIAMKKIVFLLMVTFSTLLSMAQPDEISVLFLGNSLTNGNSTIRPQVRQLPIIS